MSENEAGKGAKLREFLRRRQLPKGGNAPAGGGGAGIGGNWPGDGTFLRMILENRARNKISAAGQAASSESQLLSELRTRVDRLTENIERLRAQARNASATAPKTKKGI